MGQVLCGGQADGSGKLLATSAIGWSRLVRSSNLWVFFAKEPNENRVLWRKRPGSASCVLHQNARHIGLHLVGGGGREGLRGMEDLSKRQGGELIAGRRRVWKKELDVRSIGSMWVVAGFNCRTRERERKRQQKEREFDISVCRSFPLLYSTSKFVCVDLSLSLSRFLYIEREKFRGRERKKLQRKETACARKMFGQVILCKSKPKKINLLLSPMN